MKKFFEGVHVGDTFRFDGVAAFKALGELTVVESLSTEAGDIKLIYDPANFRCYAIEQNEFNILGVEKLYINNEALVTIIESSNNTRPFDSFMYLGRRIVYSDKNDEVFITKSEEAKYHLFYSRVIGSAEYIAREEFMTFEDAMNASYTIRK